MQKSIGQVANPKKILNQKLPTLKEKMNAEINPKTIAKALKDEHNANKQTRKREEDPAPDVEKFDDQLDISRPMQMVKDLYHTVFKEDPTITPEVAALHCDVRLSSIKKWMEDEDFKAWFETPPLTMKLALKSMTYMALREGRAMMLHKSSYVREGMVKYLINQGLGKAKPKDVAGFSEEEDIGIEDDLAQLTELEKKMKKLEEEENARSKKGTVKAVKDKTKANRNASGKRCSVRRNKTATTKTTGNNMERINKTKT